MPAVAAFDPYATKVLKKDHHDQLVRGLDRYAADARIHKRWICEPLSKHVSQYEQDWVKSFRRNVDAGIMGMILVGEAPPLDRMSALCGMLTRNFIRGRVFTLEQLTEEDGEINADCLFIPNLCGGKLPEWKVTLVNDVVLDRYMNGQQTVVHVPGVEQLIKTFGKATHDQVYANYKRVDI